MKLHGVRWVRAALLVALVGLFTPSVSRASLILTFQQSVPDPILGGSTGYVDVLIHSDSGDMLDSFVVDFAIDPSSGDLNFVDQVIDPTVNDYITDPNYVFGLSGANPFPYSANTAAYTSTILDFSASGPVLLSTTDLLLARLPLIAAANAATGTYTLRLLDSSLPSFFDADGNPIAYSSNSVDVDVLQNISTVPEPTSIALLVFGTAGCGFLIRRRRPRGGHE